MQFQDNYPLKNLTTLKIGGPAKKFAAVSSHSELLEAIQHSKENQLNYLVIGGGSNLLISDEGFDGLVIKNEIKGITQSSNEITVKSGASLQDLIDYVIKQGLSGLEKLSGIPGTVGGAVYGNAGAYGQSIADYIAQVSALNTNNLTTEEFNNTDCQFDYRSSIFKKNRFIVLEITFRFEKGNPQTLAAEAQNTISKRLIKYPAGIKSPGSFFKNLVVSQIPEELLKNISPEKIMYGKIPAGALLEEVGAKGQKADGIEIADYHANLFINQGEGTAKAFYNLAKVYADKVKERFGITLEPEVQLINLPPI